MTPKMLETGRIHIFVSGKVQGVGFRAFVQRTADEFGLSGWVRNVGFNQVETVAEGSPDVLKRFLETIRVGPRSGRVDDVNFNWEVPLGEFGRFEIRYH
jgi:acylphosphatase